VDFLPQQAPFCVSERFFMPTDSVTLSPLYNGDSVPLTAGMIVRLKAGSNDTVVRALASSSGNVQGTNGVVLSGASAPGTSVLAISIGRQRVVLEAGLTPAVGDTVYVSAATAGVGTNVIPGVVLPIGSIANVANYSRDNSVIVDVVVASSEAGAGGTFPGFGGAPPAVGTSAAGGAGTASRSDHTHTGVVSVAAGTGISLSGTASAPIINATGTAFPGFGGAPPAVAATSAAGVATTAARSDHAHQGNVVPVTNIAALAALSAAAMTPGQTSAWVTTVGALFELRISALTPDQITTVNASGLAGAQWVRLTQVGNPVAAAQATWWVNASAGNDENDGLTSGTALQTRLELSRRVWGARPNFGVTVNIVGNCPPTDAPFYVWYPTGGGFVFFLGATSVLYSGTVTTRVTQAAGPTTTDSEITDSAIPVSYTASGLMVDGVNFFRTTGATPFTALKDLGSKAIRITNLTLNNGDAYTAQLCPIICDDQTPIECADGFFYQNINLQAPNTLQYPGAFFTDCWFTTPSAQFRGGTFNRPRLHGANQNIIGGVPGVNTDLIGLVIRDSAAGIYTFTAGQFSVNTVYNQGGNVKVATGATVVVATAWNEWDTTGDALEVRYWSTLLFLNSVLNGSGNTGNLLTCRFWGQIAYNVATLLLAGSSSSGTPLVTSGANFAVSALPINVGPGGEGIFRLDVAGQFVSPTTIAAGSGVLTVTNAPAGATSYARYFTIPDGSGGVLTIGSLT
jgi:hypothetical protein